MIEGERLPVLETSRLSLRWLEDRDVDALFEIFRNPDVTRYWSCEAFESPEQARELLDVIGRCFKDKSLFEWGIALRSSDLVIGTCTLSSLSATNQRAEVGFALNRDYWHHGYMSEALDRLVEFAFDDLNLHRLEADVDPNNAASIKRLEALGFVREGYLRERWLVGGGVYDSLYYGLLQREWRTKGG